MSKESHAEDEDEETPSWMDTENDEHHRQEVEPLLFGAGAINLADPDETTTDEEGGDATHDDDDDDVETAVLTTVSGASSQASSKKTAHYGSIASSKSPEGTPKKSKKSSKLQKTTKNKLWPFLGNNDKKKQKKEKSKRVKSTTEEDYDVDNDDPSWLHSSRKGRLSYNTKTGKPEMPTPGCCLSIFYLQEGYAILTCLCLFLSQTLPIIFVPLKEINAIDFVLKIYISIFAILFMVVECDWNIPFIRNAVFLQTYLSRGFLYSFLGLTCLEESYSERVNDMLAHANDSFHVAWFALFLQVSAWSLCVLGVLYFIMGLFCLKRLRDRLVKGDRIKWNAYREALKEWKKNNAED